MPPPTFSGEQTIAIGADPLEREHRADDVDDRVERADFVQVNLLDRHLVNRRLGLGQPLEQRLRALRPAADSADRSISAKISGRLRCGCACGRVVSWSCVMVIVVVVMLVRVIMPAARMVRTSACRALHDLRPCACSS